MFNPIWKRVVSAALALLLVTPVTARAAQRTYTLIPLEEKDVTLDETVFSYTGEEIRPNVTVRVRDTLLTLDKDYTLTYADNIEVGTGKVIVTGIATASETLGYTGTVEIDFTIEAIPETTQPEETEPEVTEPETTEPETTEPEATEPEATEPETVTYKITKGDKSTWYKNSAKSLSFTVDGKYADFKGIQIDGKDLSSLYYTAREGTVITLKGAFLQKLGTGKHTVTVLFDDGKADGAFQVAEGLDTSNPETGDTFPLELWLTLMGASAAAGAALFVFRKKIFS